MLLQAVGFTLETQKLGWLTRSPDFQKWCLWTLIRLRAFFGGYVGTE